ncbi:hypothetical protein N7447_001068 [Penicillium robsamsonii]|uniref:uncharacterized protein n=1 Tax=Penicillium robsamsonii TaxID=1792511 RepID=UPI00254821B2|nr:uncharacterized protein N7447_001068 [Penicillium robsamsonii]KAJ5835042.1 hypothetical protein N7447_001068 [Penicillium robsamsonii]
MIVVFDQKCCARVLYGYFDEFIQVRLSTLNGYMDPIDEEKYYDVMHSLLRWAWPFDHHFTTQV